MVWSGTDRVTWWSRGIAGVVVAALFALSLSSPAAWAAPAWGGLTPGAVVALRGTSHLWVADEAGVLHWAGDSRALAGHDVDWGSRTEMALDALRALPRGAPWLSAGLLKDGDPIYLVKWEADEAAPRLLHIQSLADVELFGIDASNYATFVLDPTQWSQRYGLAVAGLQRALLAPATPSAAAPPGGAASVPVAAPAAAPPSTRTVIVNSVRLSADTISALERQYGLRVQDGDYWYDRVTGAFGLRGGPTLGFVVPGLDVGGPLRPDASGGTTGVFVNGRELPTQDVQALQQIAGTAPARGRYWLDARGFFGYEGGPALGNLILIAQARSASSGYIRQSYAGYIGSDGQTSYFFDPNTGCSVMTGSGVSC
jgi:hypothetical protein